MFDVVVVGAGPVGLYTAHLCEDMGYKVLVLEKNKEVGKPLRCSGLISRNIEKFFPDINGWEVIENKIDSAILHSKRSELVLKKAKAAYVINRVLFDKKISEMVRSEISFNCKAQKLRISDGHAAIDTNKGAVKCEMAAACDGPGSVFRKNGVAVKGLIAVVKKSDSSSHVDLYFDKKMLNDGFFWKIPRGKTTEYGAWGMNAKFSDIEKFFGIKAYEKFAGLIPIGAVRKSYAERLLMVGSAAGQVKPWSGGGVVYGLTCAQIAAKTIEKAFRFNDFSESVFAGYENEWKKKIGKQIKLGILFRKFLKNSNDFHLDLALRAGKFFSYNWMDMDFIL